MRATTDPAAFEKAYEGRLFTARMTVNDLTDQGAFVAVGFNDGQDETFPPVSCRVDDPNVVAVARKGRKLWVYGIVTEALGGTVFLEPCEISFSEEPFVHPAPWKTHPPKP